MVSRHGLDVCWRRERAYGLGIGTNMPTDAVGPHETLRFALCGRMWPFWDHCLTRAHGKSLSPTAVRKIEFVGARVARFVESLRGLGRADVLVGRSGTASLYGSTASTLPHCRSTLFHSHRIGWRFGCLVSHLALGHLIHSRATPRQPRLPNKWQALATTATTEVSWAEPLDLVGTSHHDTHLYSTLTTHKYCRTTIARSRRQLSRSCCYPAIVRL